MLITREGLYNIRDNRNAVGVDGEHLRPCSHPKPYFAGGCIDHFGKRQTSTVSKYGVIGTLKGSIDHIGTDKPMVPIISRSL